MARRDPTPIPNFDTAGPGAGPPPALRGALDAASTGRLRRVALRITRDAAAADDVVQNAVEKALRHGAGFRGEARPSTWLHRIVVNEALMWHRSATRRHAQLARSAAAQHEDVPAAPTPLDLLLARESRDRVRRALAKLRPEDAELLVASALEERGYGAWAQARGVRATAAKTRAFRARRALRAALEDGRPRPSLAPREATPRVDSLRAGLAPRLRTESDS